MATDDKPGVVGPSTLITDLAAEFVDPRGQRLIDPSTGDYAIGPEGNPHVTFPATELASRLENEYQREMLGEWFNEPEAGAGPMPAPSPARGVTERSVENLRDELLDQYRRMMPDQAHGDNLARLAEVYNVVQAPGESDDGLRQRLLERLTSVGEGPFRAPPEPSPFYGTSELNARASDILNRLGKIYEGRLWFDRIIHERAVSYRARMWHDAAQPRQWEPVGWQQQMRHTLIVHNTNACLKALTNSVRQKMIASDLLNRSRRFLAVYCPACNAKVLPHHDTDEPEDSFGWVCESCGGMFSVPALLADRRARADRYYAKRIETQDIKRRSLNDMNPNPARGFHK